MSIDERTRPAFGRRGRRAAGAVPSSEPPVAEPVAPAAGGGLSVPLIAAAGLLFLLALAAIVWTVPAIGGLNAESAAVTARVVEIVNQPVTHLRRSGQVAIFAPGWFHPGADKPDFDTVDIRQTQQLLYGRFGHVASDVTPDEMFIGSELEFNAMTKYFYVDRSLPKRRLSEAEMVEINGLYRVIGRDAHGLIRAWLTVIALGALACGLVYAMFRLTGAAEPA
jgi:hypothetical protein